MVPPVATEAPRAFSKLGTLEIGRCSVTSLLGRGPHSRGVPGSAGHAGVSHFVTTIPVICLLGVSSAPFMPYKTEG